MRETHPEDKVGFNDSLEAGYAMLDVIKQQAKLLRYEDVQAENQRKLQAVFQRLLTRAE
jgi:hypothetical protein